MSALTIERKTPKIGQDAVPSYTTNQPLPVAAATKLYTGAMVCLATTGANAGNVVQGQTATGLVTLGVVESTIDNSAGAAGALTVAPRQGVFLMNVGAGVDAITSLNLGQDCYVIDDNTVGLTDGGGTRSRAGVIVSVDGGTPPFSQPTGAWVLLGLTGSAPALGEDLPVAAAFKARAVVTSLQAYTGTGTNTLTETANGAWAAQDGVTNVVGDVVFIPATTTNLVGALDSGPWQIVNLGSAGTKWVLTRPAWFVTGELVYQGLDVAVGGEGAAWAGNTFRSFAAAGQVIGTNDPVFYPRMQAVTTAAMTAGVSTANSTLFVRPLAQFSPLPGTPGGTQGILRMSTTTAGYPATSSLVVTSSSNTDTSTVKIQVVNF